MFLIRLVRLASLWMLLVSFSVNGFTMRSPIWWIHLKQLKLTKQKLYYSQDFYRVPVKAGQDSKVQTILCDHFTEYSIPVLMCCARTHRALGHFELTPYQNNGCQPGEVASDHCVAPRQVVLTNKISAVPYDQVYQYCHTK